MDSLKHCGYCGREALAAATHCLGCGTIFPPSPEPCLKSRTEAPVSGLVDAGMLEEAFQVEAGFHRADWEVVRDWIQAHVGLLDQEAAWNEAVLAWVEKLRDDLGGSYRTNVSSHCVLLSDLEERIAIWLLSYAERTAVTIREALAEVAWQGALGKDVVLTFSEQDDYYQYISDHCTEGEQAASGGACLHSGYTHIAMPWQDEEQAASVIAHELTHDCLSHLPLPLWLNEGVALTLQRLIAPPQPGLGGSALDALWAAAINWRPPLMWQELAERHFDFWTAQKIQGFWDGTSFHEPGDSNELSYSLAEVLTKLMKIQTASTMAGSLSAQTRRTSGEMSLPRIITTPGGCPLQMDTPRSGNGPIKA